MNKITKTDLDEIRKSFEKHLALSNGNAEESIIAYHGLRLIQVLETIRDNADTSEDARDFIIDIQEMFGI